MELNCSFLDWYVGMPYNQMSLKLFDSNGSTKGNLNRGGRCLCFGISCSQNLRKWFACQSKKVFVGLVFFQGFFPHETACYSLFPQILPTTWSKRVFTQFALNNESNQISNEKSVWFSCTLPIYFSFEVSVLNSRSDFLWVLPISRKLKVVRKPVHCELFYQCQFLEQYVFVCNSRIGFFCQSGEVEWTSELDVCFECDSKSLKLDTFSLGSL